MKTKYEVSEEIIDLFDSASAYEDCRDECIKKVFGWKRAAYFAKRAKQENRKAWKAVYEVYPELKNKPVAYFYNDAKLILDEKNSNS